MNIKVLPRTISGLIGNDAVFAYPTEKIWNPNGISLKRRINKDKKLDSKVKTLITASNIRNYMVNADMSAPTRCVDGRPVKNWAVTLGEHATALGPKVAGGTAHAALAHRIVDAQNIKQDLLFEHDIEAVISTYKKIGIGFGGHIDDHAKGFNTGCGAVDNIDLILDKLQIPETQEQLRWLTKLIMGDAYDGAHVVNGVIGRMLFLDALKPTYMPKVKNNPRGEFLYKKTIVSTIRKASTAAQEPVPALTGAHNEVAAVLNFIPGKTFDSDRFSFDNGNKIQAFGWDIWEVYEEATRLYPYSMKADSKKQSQAVRRRLYYITTRILLGIATLMVLTDGSLKVVVIET